MRYSRGVFLIVLIAALVRFGTRYDSLPPFVASHFGASGQPNAWMSKSAFFWFMLIPVVISLFLTFVTPLFLSKLPPSMVNLPHKDYWLAPERKDETVARYSARMEWFGVALLVFFTFVFELVFDANMTGTGLANGPFIAGMIAFFAFTIGWMIAFFRAFRRPS